MAVTAQKFNQKNDNRIRRSGARRTGSTAPDGPIVGDQYYNSDSKILFVFNGTDWDPVNPPLFNLSTASGAGSTSSTSFVDWPGPIEIMFTKYAEHTAMQVVGSATNFATVVGTASAKALRINGVDYAVGTFFFNETSEHLTGPIAQRLAAGLSAGVYTARLRWRCLSGGTINSDTNDYIALQMQETV